MRKIMHTLQFLGLKKTVQLVTQRTRQALRNGLNVLCFINRDNFSLSLIGANGLRGKILSVLQQKRKHLNLDVQMQVRQLEHEADVRFHQRQRELLSRFSRAE